MGVAWHSVDTLLGGGCVDVGCGVFGPTFFPAEDFEFFPLVDVEEPAFFVVDPPDPLDPPDPPEPVDPPVPVGLGLGLGLGLGDVPGTGTETLGSGVSVGAGPAAEAFGVAPPTTQLNEAAIENARVTAPHHRRGALRRAEGLPDAACIACRSVFPSNARRQTARSEAFPP
jgi:hypothetical protein